MTTSLRRALLALAIIGALFAAALPDADAQEPPEAQHRSLYVFGDSYTSGEGVGFYIPGTDVPGNRCHKSFFSYGYRLFETLDAGPSGPWPNRFFPACSGALATNIFATPQTADGIQLAQAAPVPDGGVGYAFMTIGGNDLGFAEILTECTVTTACHVNSTHPTLVDPWAAWEAKSDDIVESIIRIANWKLGSGEMDVFLLGYPRLFADGSTALNCLPALGIDPDERAALNDLGSLINFALATVAALLPNVHFVDVDSHFTGHRLCDPEPWVHGLQLPIEHSYHPNPTGHFVLEQVVLNYLTANGFM